MELVATWVFWVCLIAVLYVLFGYPLLLACLARFCDRPVLKQPGPRTVSLVLAVYNGERWIEDKLRSILQLDYPHLIEILIASDGSTDRTEEIVLQCDEPRVRLIRLPRGGKARAVNAGMARATGELLFFTDVRQELAADSLSRLAACFADPAVGVASGELVIHEGDSREEAHVGFYWRYEKLIRKRLTRIDSVLGATGCIYAMRRELAAPLPPDSLVDDMYLPLAAFFRGYRVILEESAKAYDYPTALRSEFQRKVRTQAGVYQVIQSYPALLSPANRMWLHFVSHKLGRLLLPWMLLVIFASGFALPGMGKWVATGAQAVFYGLALVDVWVPERRWFKHVSSPVRTFVTLMAAAFCATSVLFAPRRPLWNETQVRDLQPRV